MTRLANDPREFAREMTEGFVAANGAYVRAVEGGVVRASGPTPGTVALVIGGGSGHYPAFAGLVGPGMAAGAAMGNIFASPAAAHVESVARAAERGAGVLLSYGNYAGDVLNFDEAQRALRADGIACETVVVTDDVSSAPAEQAHLRRGIAGDLVVFKCAGAAAEEGRPLAEVVRVARHANARTRTLGVAFDGCTLPGADAPLFTVPAGRMGLGMGVHGEPGIAEVTMPSADGLAEMLVGGLLAEVPAGVGPVEGARVVPILNGLGSVKYEEMFVVYRRVAQLLAARGLEVVDPHVGEFCTSFDMAGVSLTLFWPDDELARLWAAPTDTAAYRRVGVVVRPMAPAASAEATAPARAAAPVTASAPSADVPSADGADPADNGALRARRARAADAASPASRRLAERVVVVLEAVAAAIEGAEDELGRLDAVAGDGDHGIGMRRGSGAALEAAREAAALGAGAGTVLDRAGAAWAREAGGTSGALWGSLLRAVAEVVGDDGEPGPGTVADAVAAASARVQERGGARVGDKTMVDALVPYEQVLAAELATGATVAAACRAAARAAADAAAATADLVARVGRARPHAERSRGTPDPGARSLAVVAAAVAEAVARPGMGGGSRHG